MKKINDNDIFFSCFYVKYIFLICYNLIFLGCLVFYIGVFLNLKRVGLWFVVIFVIYFNVRCDCVVDGGDLIKIDMYIMLCNFVNFIESK